MLIQRSVVLKLYPTETQEQILQQHVDDCATVYNLALRHREALFREHGKYTSAVEQSRVFTAFLNTPQGQHLYRSNSQSLRRTLVHLQQAYDAFYKNLEQWKKKPQGERPQPPKPKDKGTSYYISNQGLRIEGVPAGTLGLPKMKEPVKFRGTIERIPQDGKVTCSNVFKKPSGWYIAISYEYTVADPDQKTGPTIGVDVGLKSFVTYSDGTKVEHPKHYTKAEKRLKRIQRQQSRREEYRKRVMALPKDHPERLAYKGSNLDDAKHRTGRLMEHIANQRKDFLHKTSIALVTQAATIGIEDLNVAAMQRGMLSKSIGHTGFSEFRRQIEYKALPEGVRVHVVERFYPSSQTCSRCGHKNTQMRNLSERTMACTACDYTIDRDVNAAINLQHAADANLYSAEKKVPRKARSYKRKDQPLEPQQETAAEAA